jgi:hypothetical protein
MKIRRTSIRVLPLALSLAALLLAPIRAGAGTYITVSLDGSPSDWSGIPVAFTGNVNTPDISKVQLANDSNYFYIGITFTNPVNLQFTSGGGDVFLGFDTDSNSATGFDIFGAGQVGSELGYQNDFPFQQASGNFNSGSVSGGGGLIAPFDSSSVSFMEIGIPLNSTYVTGGLATFPNQSFNLGIYTQNMADSSANFTGALSYTLAEVPEPGSMALLAGGGILSLAAGVRRHVKHRLMGF